MNQRNRIEDKKEKKIKRLIKENRSDWKKRRWKNIYKKKKYIEKKKYGRNL